MKDVTKLTFKFDRKGGQNEETDGFEVLQMKIKGIAGPGTVVVDSGTPVARARPSASSTDGALANSRLAVQESSGSVTNDKAVMDRYQYDVLFGVLEATDYLKECKGPISVFDASAEQPNVGAAPVSPQRIRAAELQAGGGARPRGRPKKASSSSSASVSPPDSDWPPSDGRPRRAATVKADPDKLKREEEELEKLLGLYEEEGVGGERGEGGGSVKKQKREEDGEGEEEGDDYGEEMEEEEEEEEEEEDGSDVPDDYSSSSDDDDKPKRKKRK
jgi:hypothetical protein